MTTRTERKTSVLFYKTMKTPIYITTMGLSAFLALTPTLAAEQTKLSVQGRMPTQEKRQVQSDTSEQAKVQMR